MSQKFLLLAWIRKLIPSDRQITTNDNKARMDACINDESPAGYWDAAIISWMVTESGLNQSDVDGSLEKAPVLKNFSLDFLG